MNAELFTLPHTTRREDALEVLLEMDITAAPVIDSDRRPRGVTTLRDLLRDETKTLVSAPALSVDLSSTVEDAAHIMLEKGCHHLVVVRGDGRIAGMVSSLDLLRGVLGLPPHFPATFPHRDADLGVTWTDLQPFDRDHLRVAPEGAGVLVLSMGGALRTEADLWVESAAALRARVSDLLEITQRDAPALARILERRDLRYRCATIRDPALQARVTRRLRERIDRASVPA